VNARRGTQLREFAQLYAWSLAEPGHFWSELARFADVRADWGRRTAHRHPGRMPGARFFPRCAAELRRQPAAVRRRSAGTGVPQRARARAGHSRNRELRTQVAAWPMDCGGWAWWPVTASPAFLPNLPEASHRDARHGRASGPPGRRCSPDFGVRGVLDRFRADSTQGAVHADGYFYAGKQLEFAAAHVRGAGRNWRRSSSWVVIPYVDPRPNLAALGPRPGAPATGRSFGVNGRAASFVSLTLRPSAVHPVLVRHDRRAPSASCMAPAARCYSIRRAPAATPTEAQRPAVLLHDLWLDECGLAD